MKKGLQYKPPKKSAGQELMENLVMVALVSVLVYIIGGIFRLIFYPLTWLFKSSDQLYREDVERALAKKRARELYQVEIKKSPRDPMNQYLERFVNDPEAYKGDPDNEGWLQWYLEWRNGNVLDSRLRWAPDIYVKIEGMNVTNLEFVKYLEIQHELHKEAGWTSRHCFLQTIRKFYPEVAPNMRDMGMDIETLKDRAQAPLEYQALAQEIRKLGIPEEVSKALSRQRIPGEQMLAKAKTIKRCIERGYVQSAALFIADEGYGPDSDEASGANTLLSNGCPDYVAREYLAGRISTEEAKELGQFLKAIMEIYEEKAFDIVENGEIRRDALLKGKLAEIKASHRKRGIDAKAGKALWQN